MARSREGVLYSPAGSDAVWVKAHRSRPGVYSIWWTDASGKHHEQTAPSQLEAKTKADQIAAMHGLPNGTKALAHLINHYLNTKRPDHWSDNYHNSMTDLAKAFFPMYGVACGDLNQAHPEKVIANIRTVGNAPATEIRTMQFWGRLVKHGRKWGYLSPTAEGQPLDPRTELRKVSEIKQTGESDKVWHRDELPPWNDLWAYCDAAEEITGSPIEWLRAAWLMTGGDRWGEVCGARGTHLWLASGSKLLPGQRLVAGKYTEVTCKNFVWDDYTKAGTTRVTAYHRALADRVEARFAELENEDDLLFPDPWLTGPMCRHDYMKKVFIPAGLAVGWPVAGRKQGRMNKKGVLVPGAVSSLVWHPHSFRHVACTSMATTRLDDPDRWFEGWSMTAYEIALAVGDKPETIQRTYFGKSAAGVEAVRTANGWD